MKVSKAAMAAALAFGVIATAAGGQAPAPAPQQVRAISLSREERAAVTAVQASMNGADRAAQDRALAAARVAARSPEGRYAVGYYQLEIGRMRGDAQLQAAAVDQLIESGHATPAETVSLLGNQASRALAARDLPRTERLLARMVELRPNDPVTLADYAELKARMGQPANAAGLLQRAVEAAQTTGRPAPESWHLRGLALAFESRSAPAAFVLALHLVTNYPNAVNWRDALLAYRELSPPDPALTLDVQRLMRASQSLGGERDYLEYAEAARAAGLAGEAKAVIDDGVSRGMLETARVPPALTTATGTRAVTADRGRLAGQRTAALAAATGQPARNAGDAHFGYGLYAEAAELYRAALQKGGEDPNLVNSRLGAALALAGRRPEAEAALRAVTGPRAELAGFWLAWLSRQPASA